MAKHAHAIGSSDNITVMILLLLRTTPTAGADIGVPCGDEEDYSVFSSFSKAKPIVRNSSWSSEVKLTLKPPVTASPLSPGALSSEIMAVMKDSQAPLADTGNNTTCEKGKNESTGECRDPDDDLMSFLMDDSNF